ncbi:hypothetical protein EVAR_32939_1 [Eumeta japonica]|uniref:Reverse transcriptase domain-containing protein n=1 Tax=Eumeta variegata TaxID=151549 RepID=A0A4C1X2P9_EUMVA|nr:hypothetical protein EVAR_32939_1 [Eumeta japonica]
MYVRPSDTRSTCSLKRPVYDLETAYDRVKRNDLWRKLFTHAASSGSIQYGFGLSIDELSIKCLLYADDQVILASSAGGLQEIVNKINDTVKKRGAKVNVGETKVMVFERVESTTECNILREGEKVEQVKEFVYLDGLFTSDGKYDRGIERKVNAGNEK